MIDVSMDSHKFFGGGKRGGYSKAQMCLQNILSIITSIPPHDQYEQKHPKPESSFHQVLDSSSSSSSSNCQTQPFGHLGFHIDLNLELTSPSETEKSWAGIDSTETKSNHEKDEKEEDYSFVDEKSNSAVSEADFDGKKITESPFCNREFEEEDGCLLLCNNDETGELSSEKGSKSELGGLGTELETQEIYGVDEEPMKEEEEEEEARENRVSDLYGRFDEVSQVVRTKRGRRRVLPCRYKDSVLQPLARNHGSRKKRQHFKVKKKSI